jgi:hypothetical protein
MRDEDRVDALVRGRFGGRPEPAQRTEPVTEDRIGQQSQAVELEEDGRVADEGEPVAQNPLQSRRPPLTVLPASEGVAIVEPRIADLIWAAVAVGWVLL